MTDRQFIKQGTLVIGGHIIPIKNVEIIVGSPDERLAEPREAWQPDEATLDRRQIAKRKPRDR
jgi:hypothetical protein